MEEQFSNRYSKMEDVDLVRVMTRVDDLKEEAKAALANELNNRNLSESYIEEIRRDLKRVDSIHSINNPAFSGIIKKLSSYRATLSDDIRIPGKMSGKRMVHYFILFLILFGILNLYYFGQYIFISVSSGYSDHIYSVFLLLPVLFIVLAAQYLSKYTKSGWVLTAALFYYLIFVDLLSLIYGVMLYSSYADNETILLDNLYPEDVTSAILPQLFIFGGSLIFFHNKNIRRFLGITSKQIILSVAIAIGLLALSYFGVYV